MPELAVRRKLGELKAGLFRLEDLRLSSFIISQEIRVPQFLNFSSLAGMSRVARRGLS